MFFGLCDLPLAQHIALCLLAWGRTCLLVRRSNECLLRFFLTKPMYAPLPSKCLFLVLATRDLRNVSRRASFLEAAFTLLALAF